MQFVNIPFPERIAFGAASAAEWETELVTMAGGHDDTNENWEDNKHRFDAAPAVRTASAYALVRAHFNQVRGRARSFPFKDFLDYRVTDTDGVLVEVDGGGWQLSKVYGSGGNEYIRRITRPDTAGFRIIRVRSGVHSNVTGSATVDMDTGFVSAITGDTSGDTYLWMGTFVVPCRYDVDILRAAVINKQPNGDGDLLVQSDPIPIVEVRE